MAGCLLPSCHCHCMHCVRPVSVSCIWRCSYIPALQLHPMPFIQLAVVCTFSPAVFHAKPCMLLTFNARGD